MEPVDRWILVQCNFSTYFQRKDLTVLFLLNTILAKVTDIAQVSTDEEIDFQANRSLAYVYRMALWTPRELVKTLLR